jgi:7-cyano-7-deazaguanine synthase
VNARRVVVLFSGGVESTCLLYYYLRRGWLVYPAYVSSGYPWEALELENAIRLYHHTKERYKNLFPLRVLKTFCPERVGKRSHCSNLFIPLRNLLLLSTVSAYCLSKGIGKLAIGSLGIYPFPDNNREYMQRFRELSGLEVLTPFMGLEKHEVIQKFGSGVPLELTLSCIRPKKVKGSIRHCGDCLKCEERKEAFKHLSL